MRRVACRQDGGREVGVRREMGEGEGVWREEKEKWRRSDWGKWKDAELWLNPREESQPCLETDLPKNTSCEINLFVRSSDCINS